MEKTIKIFSIFLDGCDDPQLVEADDMEEAISKFKRYAQNSDDYYYYLGRDIRGITLTHEFHVIS